MVQESYIANAQLIHFKDKYGKIIDGQLVVGMVDLEKEEKFDRFVEREVERNLGKFKKVLAYLGIIKSTKKVIEQESRIEKVILEKQKRDTLGIRKLGNFYDRKEEWRSFLNDNKGLKAYDINNNEVGYIDDTGHFKSEKDAIKCDETILKKDGEVFAIEKNGKFLDLEGQALPNQNQITVKSNTMKTFSKDQDTNIGFPNATSKPNVSKEAKKIGEDFQKKQEQGKFAGINKPRGAKLTKVAPPKVPAK